MAAIRYLKVTQTDGTRYILRVTRESPGFIHGFEVNAEGDEVVPAGYERRHRTVDRGLIKKTVEMRMNPKYTTLEIVPASEQTKKTAAQLDADIAESILRTRKESRRDKSTRKQLPDAARAAIEERVLTIIEGTYKRYQEFGRSVGHKEPCLSVGLITDDLRQQSGLPEDFRWATKTRQRTWARSILESMRRRGLIGASFGVGSRCYEPKR